jgi:hypothetical protein
VLVLLLVCSGLVERMDGWDGPRIECVLSDIYMYTVEKERPTCAWIGTCVLGLCRIPHPRWKVLVYCPALYAVLWYIVIGTSVAWRRKTRLADRSDVNGSTLRGPSSLSLGRKDGSIDVDGWMVNDG